ncbi:hypothetical protein RQM65_03145 [Pricia sp. S334]|uniref:Uncharacterized protein n=1 Tax=Pricia mediterranea TaxID=3076079 RepID=A0ABU3L1Q4_9FLAO|nr:hypothetical protein [Pricia sp. S334]MDT7827661.1 hypothetical protein [Pricia sp. S334]
MAESQVRAGPALRIARALACISPKVNFRAQWIARVALEKIERRPVRSLLFQDRPGYAILSQGERVDGPASFHFCFGRCGLAAHRPIRDVGPGGPASAGLGKGVQACSERRGLSQGSGGDTHANTTYNALRGISLQEIPACLLAWVPGGKVLRTFSATHHSFTVTEHIAENECSGAIETDKN